MSATSNTWTRTRQDTAASTGRGSSQVTPSRRTGGRPARRNRSVSGNGQEAADYLSNLCGHGPHPGPQRVVRHRSSATFRSFSARKPGRAAGTHTSRHDGDHGDFGGEKQSTRRLGAMVGHYRGGLADRRMDQQGSGADGCRHSVSSGPDLVTLPSASDMRRPRQRTGRWLPQQRGRTPYGLPHPPASLAEAQDADLATPGPHLLLRTFHRWQGRPRDASCDRQLPLRPRGLHPQCGSQLSTAVATQQLLAKRNGSRGGAGSQFPKQMPSSTRLQLIAENEHEIR